MSKEKLEEINDMINAFDESLLISLYGYEIHAPAIVDDFKYLLKRVQKLEESNKNMKYNIRYVNEQNKRYRESMKKIWKLTETDAGTEEQVFIIADDILKQDKEEVKKTDDRTVDSPHSSWF